MITCLGEALIDLMPTDSSRLTWRARPGGAPMNVAVAAGRLDAPVRFVGHLSTDRFGRLLRDHLDDAGVDLGYCVTSDTPTTLAVVDSGGADSEPSFSFYACDTTAVTFEQATHLVPDDGIVHLSGSVSAVLEPAASAFAELLGDHRRHLVTIDPNPRPAIIGTRGRFRSHLDAWLAHADLVKVSRADLAWIEPSLDTATIAQHWMERGVRVVVVTRGSEGAVAYTPAGTVEAPVTPVEVVDTVGAGDSFMGGLLTMLHEHEAVDVEGLSALDAPTWTEIMAFSGRVAALACRRVGADPPRRAELADLLG